MVKTNINPISGFPEWSPAQRIAEQQMLDIIRREFERFGFTSIETPAVERNETLTAKSGEEAKKQIYRLGRLSVEGEKDDDARDYSLHFDLTIPLARYVAQYFHDLTFPFRRYQIQKVWRGERPQEGRFREFYQCDIDIIGNSKLSFLADAEIPAVINEVFSRLNIGQFRIRINNRKILGGYLSSLGIQQNDISSAMSEIDGLEKHGIDCVVNGLSKFGIARKKAETLVEFITQTEESNDAMFSMLNKMNVGEEFEQGVEELSVVMSHAKNYGIPEERLSIDLSIVRGLDYYTGTVYETSLINNPSIGSICSGGRYDDLAGYFTERKLPGVGISIGLTRLFSQLLRTDLIDTSIATTADVLVTTPKSELMPTYIALSTAIRAAGINTELYLEKDQLSKQLGYASKKGFRVAVIVHESEYADSTVRLKDLKHAKEIIVSKSDFVQKLKAILKMNI